ncbi:Extracellular metalloproteinase 4 [Rhizoctonia solani]|uniref:Extracellular metalloproteinase n=1 Tax=Rhizoctonia solani TaxID=456999 RepID=A0A0K6G382_9AGAM|nr:Extracellular metalloproteinase 4 [Rhizoctonia solani]
MVRSVEESGDFPMGSWASNEPMGIRYNLYSTNTSVNSLTYESINDPRYTLVHGMGEVWAEILWAVSGHMISIHGFSSTLLPPQPLSNGTVPVGDFYLPGSTLVPKHGNTLMIQLVILAMKLQPCRPSFFDARDAIMAADRFLTGGKNECELWVAFSSRGLGIDALLKGGTPWGGGHHVNGYKVPDQCKVDKKIL